jgi:hypothetical protein
MVTLTCMPRKNMNLRQTDFHVKFIDWVWSRHAPRLWVLKV